MVAAGSVVVGPDRKDVEVDTLPEPVGETAPEYNTEALLNVFFAPVVLLSDDVESVFDELLGVMVAEMFLLIVTFNVVSVEKFDILLEVLIWLIEDDEIPFEPEGAERNRSARGT